VEQDPMKKVKRISFWNLWAVLVMAGVLGGTVWANLLGRELLGQIGYFDGIYQTGKIMDNGEQWELWRYVLGQRAWEVCFGGLLAMTPFAVPGYLVLAFGAGFALAVMITMFTLEKGWMGIGYWLASVLPHGICYLVIWMILTEAVKEKQDMKKIRVWLFSGFLVTAGSFLETWANPWLLKWL